MRIGAACIVLALVLLGTAKASARDAAPPAFPLVGFDPPLPAPAFEAPSLPGASVALSDFRGRHVLLNFWATWCPPCLDEMPSMETLYQAFKARGLVVVAVSSDAEGAAVVRGFVDRLSITFPVLLDPEQEVAALYSARNLPVSFLLDPSGRVVAAAQGARDWASPEARSVIDGMLPRP